MDFSTKRTLVTGGAGFLGSHFCEQLFASGHEVLRADTYYCNTMHNILHLLGDNHFKLMRHDITFPIYAEVDEIYNLACPASPAHYQRNPVKPLKTSVHGAINMLGLAKRKNAIILQTSTSEVYGDPSVHPQVERYWGNVNPIGIRFCHDEGKRLAKNFFFDYYRKNVLRIKMPRLFSIYGPRMHRKTNAWCPTPSCRRCAASSSPFTATARKPAPSAMLMIRSGAYPA